MFIRPLRASRCRPLRTAIPSLLFLRNTSSNSSAPNTTRSSTNPSSPAPVLSDLREQLKAALRTKDTPRLNVVRGILADITNSTKDPARRPIETDASLLKLLTRRIRKSEDAMKDFAQAGRQDLVAKEGKQVAVLKELAARIPNSMGLAGKPATR